MTFHDTLEEAYAAKLAEDETRTVYGITPMELFRLTCAYAAIRDPAKRADFLGLVEFWAKDQWRGTG